MPSLGRQPTAVGSHTKRIKDRLGRPGMPIASSTPGEDPRARHKPRRGDRACPAPGRQQWTFRRLRLSFGSQSPPAEYVFWRRDFEIRIMSSVMPGRGRTSAVDDVRSADLGQPREPGWGEPGIHDHRTGLSIPGSPPDGSAPRMSKPDLWASNRFHPIVAGAATATDPVVRTTHPRRCPWSSGRDLAPPQRRALPCAVRAAGPGAHSFLRCSAARNKFCSPHRSAG